MTDDSRKPTIAPCDENDDFDRVRSIPDEEPERKPSVEESDRQEHQPHEEDEARSSETLKPLWKLWEEVA